MTVTIAIIRAEDSELSQFCTNRGCDAHRFCSILIPSSSHASGWEREILFGNDLLRGSLSLTCL
jgi:hypothetical protein